MSESSIPGGPETLSYIGDAPPYWWNAPNTIPSPVPTFVPLPHIVHAEPTTKYPIGFYKRLEDVPSEHRHAVSRAMSKRGVDGNLVLEMDKDGNLNLTEDILRMIVICYRAGLFE